MLTAALALAPILARFIPDIVGWLGGDDAESVASQVVGAVTAVAGSSDPAVVAATLDDPAKGAELALGLARIAAEREKAKDEAQLARFQAGLADVADARRMGVQLAASGSKLAWAPTILSSIIILGFFGVILALFFIDKRWDERTVNMVNGLFGTLTVAFGGVVQYWLGSARDGAVKDERQQQAVAMLSDTARRVMDTAPVVAAAAATTAAATAASAAADAAVRPLFINRGSQS